MVKRGRSAVSHFCGWPELTRFMSKCRTPIMGALFATLFLTGCRISEVLEMKPEMFIREPKRIMIYGVPVLKKRGKSIRSVPVPYHEKLVLPMMDWVDNCEYEYLFWDIDRVVKTSQKKFMKIPGVPSRYNVYAWILKTDPAWWPHRIRSERATQLAVEYKYTVRDLMQFFYWSKPDVAMDYVRLRAEDIGDKMIPPSS